MLRRFSPLLLFWPLLAGIVHAEEGDSLWSNAYGENKAEWVTSIIGTGDGGFLLAGGIAFFCPSDEDVLLVKVNSQGDSLWSRSYGGSNEDYVSAIFPSSDGGFLLAGWSDSFGLSSYDMWLLKVDAEGDSVWCQTYGGIYHDYACAIIPSGDGGFLLTGWSDTCGPTSNDLILVKVNSEGDLLWTQTHGGDGDEVAISIIPSEDGGFLLTGFTTSCGAGGQDFWLLKVDAEGDSLWSRTYGGIRDEAAISIIPCGEGEYFLAGWTNSFGAGQLDIWLVKVNSQGDSLWSRTYGSFYWDWASSIIPSGDGNFLLAGWTKSFGAGYSDMWLVKVNSQGDSLWTHTYGGARSDRADAIIATEDGGFLLAGLTTSFSLGDDDMWLVKVEGPALSVAPRTSFQPVETILYPPHPNPFNPTTTLSFELRGASFVKLEVFDIHGRIVGARHVSPLPGVGFGESDLQYYPAGTHRITLDGSGLPSGIYLARLSAGDWSATQKLVLMK